MAKFLFFPFFSFIFICMMFLSLPVFAQEEGGEDAEAAAPAPTKRPNAANIVATGEERAFSTAEIRLLQELERERIKLEPALSSVRTAGKAGGFGRNAHDR